MSTNAPLKKFMNISNQITLANALTILFFVVFCSYIVVTMKLTINNVTKQQVAGSRLKQIVSLQSGVENYHDLSTTLIKDKNQVQLTKIGPIGWTEKAAF